MNDWGEGPVFVDTNILFYAVDHDAGAKQQKAQQVLEAIWTQRTGVISTQILSEWAVNLRRKMQLGWQAVDRIVRPYLAWKVVVLEPADPLVAVRLSSRHRLSYWDALVITAAKKAQARILLTEDLNPGKEVEGIELVSPF